MGSERSSAPSSPATPLYGRRIGKPLRAAQRTLVATLLPTLKVDVTAPIEIATLFPFTPREVRLEIGFGAGEHLIAEAARQPQTGFIGCEPFLNGMARTLADLAAHPHPNIRLHDGDAQRLIAALPSGSLAGIDLLYPDPWPKRRHRKRRFVSDETLRELARVLAVGGTFRFATDIDDYCGWTLARLLRSADFDWPAVSAADWQRPWPHWTPTRYERKAVEAGRHPAYITAVRRAPARVPHSA
jgi:tRNA (guanine-N7-)-methyltransferase